MRDDLYHDIDCPKCRHYGRHVVGRTTGVIYCLTCGGECRKPEWLAA